MSIVGAIMVPHPPLILPEVGRGRERVIEETAKSYEKAAEFVASLQPETIVLSSPHSVMYRDYLHISPGDHASGNMARFGAPRVVVERQYDEEFSRRLCKLAEKDHIPAGYLGEKDPTLDHGTIVPLYFILQKYQNFRLVRMGISGISLAEQYRFGMLVQQAAEELGRRVVYVASGDLSHKLKEDGPYGLDPHGPIYDQKIMEVMGSADFEKLLEFDPVLLEKAAECGHRSFVIMAGALDRLAVEAHELSHQDVTGVGYGICTYKVTGRDESRNFLDQYEAKERDRLARKKSAEDPYVALARKTVETYVRTGKKLTLEEVKAGVRAEAAKAQFPGQGSASSTQNKVLTHTETKADGSLSNSSTASEESDPVSDRSTLTEEMLQQKAGCFVSLHERGELRGCIGTIGPVCSCVAEEILHNAISAATRDPRFDPVRKDELDKLEYSVDVLGAPEEIHDPAQLDPKRYGVIVTWNGRRGLLLPDLDGVDTIADQIAIARRKADIPDFVKPADIHLQRFEVVRHY